MTRDLGRRRGGTVMKVVVTGPFAAGKTTLVSAVSETAVLATETTVTDSTRTVKANTTVALDFGRITTGDGTAIHLFGTPGQERFEFMREILALGMAGYLLVVDGCRPETWAEARTILEGFRAASAAPFVVTVNRALALDVALEVAIRDALGLDTRATVAGIDARDPDDVRAVLIQLLDQVISALRVEEGAMA